MPWVLTLWKAGSWADLSESPGDLGVSLFFVLSGFLITRLLVAEQKVTGGVSLARFYLRRSLRIFPAYYFFLVVAYFATPNVRLWNHAAMLAALFYAWNYYYNVVRPQHPYGPDFIGHIWSLAVEEQFYLLWPVFFKWRIRAGRQAVGRALVVVIGVVFAWRSFLVLGGHATTDYAYAALDTRLDCLAVGCLLAIWSEEAWFQLLARSVVKARALPFLTLLALGASRYGLADRWRFGPGLTVQAVLLGVFLIQVLQLHQHWAWSWLDQPFMRFLGTISYSIYLYHTVGLWQGHVGYRHVWAKVGVGAVWVLALAVLSYLIVERPFLALRRWLDRAWLSRATSEEVG